VLHLRGVGSARSRVMTGRASGRGSIDGWPSGWVVRPGRRRRTTTGECAGWSIGRSASRGGWARTERRRRGKGHRRGDAESEAKRKRKRRWREMQGTERTKPQEASPRAKRERQQGAGRGIGRALGRSAARVRDHLGKDAESEQLGSQWEDCASQGTALGAWLGGPVWWGPLAAQVPVGPPYADRRLVV